MKKMINYHTHTYRCGHALGNEYEMVEAALHEGYQELGMSCHIALLVFRQTDGDRFHYGLCGRNGAVD